MTTISKLKREIDAIKARNQRVEADKAWETSWVRKLILAAMTYGVVLSFFLISGLPNPYVNALIPALAFILSTLSLPIFKSIWMNTFYKK